MTTRVTREAGNSTEAELGPDVSRSPITLHDASMDGDMAEMLPKVKVGCTVIPAKAGISGEGATQEPHEIPAFAGMTISA